MANSSLEEIYVLIQESNGFDINSITRPRNVGFTCDLEVAKKFKREASNFCCRKYEKLKLISE